MTPRVVLVAAEAAGLRALRLVLDRCVLTAVVTDDEALGRAARERGVPVLPGATVAGEELAGWILAEEVDLLLNVHSLHLVHGPVVRAPRIGSFNLHPGLLPAYAGLNAPSWAIYNEEARHGVTLHWMDETIDTGPVAYAAVFPIEESDTGLSLALRCVTEGLPLVARLLAVASDAPSSIPTTPQDLSRRRYFGRDAPNGGRLLWDVPASRVVAFVRASDYRPFPSPWGFPRALYGAGEVRLVVAARTGIRRPVDVAPGAIGDVGGGAALVAAADEWIRLERIEHEGVLLTPDVLLRPGDRFESDS